MNGMWEKVVKSGNFGLMLPLNALQGTELSAKPSPKNVKILTEIKA